MAAQWGLPMNEVVLTTPVQNNWVQRTILWCNRITDSPDGHLWYLLVHCPAENRIDILVKQKPYLIHAASTFIVDWSLFSPRQN